MSVNGGSHREGCLRRMLGVAGGGGGGGHAVVPGGTGLHDRLLHLQGMYRWRRPPCVSSRCIYSVAFKSDMCGVSYREGWLYIATPPPCEVLTVYMYIYVWRILQGGVHTGRRRDRHGFVPGGGRPDGIYIYTFLPVKITLCMYGVSYKNVCIYITYNVMVACRKGEECYIPARHPRTVKG